MDEDKKKPWEKQPPKYTKVMIKFEEDLFDYWHLQRVEVVEEFDAESPTGMKYGFVVSLSSYPFKKEFWYATTELRDSKKQLLESKITSARGLII